MEKKQIRITYEDINTEDKETTVVQLTVMLEISKRHDEAFFWGKNAGTTLDLEILRKLLNNTEEGNISV